MYGNEYRRNSQEALKKAKLGLLAIGVLILGALLFYGEGQGQENGLSPGSVETAEETGKAGESEEPEKSEKPEEEGKAGEPGEPEEEPDSLPLSYDGSIRVLLKTDNYEK